MIELVEEVVIKSWYLNDQDLRMPIAEDVKITERSVTIDGDSEIISMLARIDDVEYEFQVSTGMLLPYGVRIKTLSGNFVHCPEGVFIDALEGKEKARNLLMEIHLY